MENNSVIPRRRAKRPLIAFAANPFVALADFVVVLVLVLMLAFVHQALSNSRLIERLAVDQAQKGLLAECAVLPGYDSAATGIDNANHKFDPATARFFQSYADGDLQRFRLDNAFKPNSITGRYDKVGRDGSGILLKIGGILKAHQGDLNDPGSGLFKRIILEGHADQSEGKTDDETWNLSLSRSLFASRYLQQAGLSPKLIEVSGRGIYYPAAFPEDESNVNVRVAKNRYLDVIIVFSGERSLKYSSNRTPLMENKQ